MKNLEMIILLPIPNMPMDFSEEAMKETSRSLIMHLLLMFNQHITKIIPDLTPEAVTDFLNEIVTTYIIEGADASSLPDVLTKNTRNTILSTITITLPIPDEFFDNVMKNTNPISIISFDAATQVAIKDIIGYQDEFSVAYTFNEKSTLN